MQPRMTQVPPTRDSSVMATRAPALAAMRAALTPPEPAPGAARNAGRSGGGGCGDNCVKLALPRSTGLDRGEGGQGSRGVVTNDKEVEIVGGWCDVLHW